jgi:hypothetical protein
MLVLMALITTVMTTPLLLRLMRGTELEPHVRQSSFWRGKRRHPPVAAEAAFTEETT